MKYSKDEILEIIKVNHKQRMQFESGLPSSDEIKFDLSIDDWIDDFELLGQQKLGEAYSSLFKIPYSKKEWNQILFPSTKRTLSDLTLYISKKAIKPTFKKIKLFNKECLQASIFRYLKNELIKRDDKFSQLKPSSSIGSYLVANAGDIIEEVNLLSSKTLPLLQYDENELEKQSWKPLLFGFLLLVIASILNDNWIIGTFGFGVLCVGFWMGYEGSRRPPKKIELTGFMNFRDIIESLIKTL